MKRSKPLRRLTPLRRKPKVKSVSVNSDGKVTTRYEQRTKRSTKPMKASKPLRKVSTKQAAKLRTYAKIRIEKLNEDPMCQRCGAMATQTHHRKGRGIHLDEREWLMSACLSCHAWIHENPNQARKDGWIID